MIRNDEELRMFYNAGTPVSHPNDAILQDWTTRIQSGERGAEIDGIARYIIKDFRLRQFLGVAQSPVTLQWLADVLGDMVDYKDKDALTTLGLMPRPAKRPVDPQNGWDICCWIAVSELRGHAPNWAIAAAADLFHKDVSTVRKLLKKNMPEWMNPTDEVWEEYFQIRRRPLPPRISRKEVKTSCLWKRH